MRQLSFPGLAAPAAPAPQPQQLPLPLASDDAGPLAAVAPPCRLSVVLLAKIAGLRAATLGGLS